MCVVGRGGGPKRKRSCPCTIISIKESIFFWILKLRPDVFKEHNFYISYESERLVLLCFLCWEKIRLKTQNSAPL